MAQYFHDKPGLDVLLGDALLVDIDLKPLCYRRIMVPNRWHTRLDHLHSLSCAMFFKPSALPDPPLDPKYTVISDAVLMDYFLGSGKNIHACRMLLATYAFTGQNLSGNISHGEDNTWLEECGWHRRIFRPFAVIVNRMRRLLHGGYRNRYAQCEIFTHSSPDIRKPVECSLLSGVWPKNI